MYWIGIFIVNWLIADFLSGVFHWWEDRYAREDWPLLGKWVAAPNQLHHRDPVAMTRNGYWFRNSTTMLPAMLLAAGICLAWGPTVWLLTPVMLSQANEVHAWAHRRGGALVLALQETGIVQSARHHAGHHRAPFDCRYCVMSNWLNPVLDRINFWRALERVVCCALLIAPAR